MRSWLLFLIIFSTPLVGEEKCGGGANLVYELDPETLVAECVSVDSGALSLADTDIAMEGPNALPLVRFTNSMSSTRSDLGDGISTNYPTRVSYLDRHADHYHVWLEEVGGGSLQFKGSGANDGVDLKLAEQAIRFYGVVNTGGGEISGRTNLKNHKISYRSDEAEWKKGGKAGDLQLVSGTGDRRNFRTRKLGKFDAFLLDTEERGNGTHARYEYAKDDFWKKVSICSSENQELRWLRFDDTKMETELTYEASNGHSVQYHYELPLQQKYGITAISKVIPSHAPEIEYVYQYPTRRRREALLSTIKRPEGRFLGVDYYQSGRVQALYSPIGKSGAAERLYQFSYHNTQGNKPQLTVVRDGTGGKRHFQFDGDKRLKEIKYYDSDGSIVRTTFLSWGRNGTQDEGNLVSKGIKDKSGKIVCCWSLHYDQLGNLVKEVLHGNLSGTSEGQIELGVDGRPRKGGHETFTKWSRYSEDGRNLKTWEQEENGPEIEYCYREGTDLLTAKLTKVGGEILLREFVEYDAVGTELMRIGDDGSAEDRNSLTGVTRRIVTEITPQSDPSQPGYGQPLEARESYIRLSTGEKKSLGRKEFSYVKGDLVSQIDTYDARGRWRYREFKEYDEKGRLIRETDPMGITTTHDYDANFNEVATERVGSGYRTENVFDKGNRLVERSEVHDDGEKVSNRFQYDVLGRVSGETDRHGETTIHYYDGVGRRIESSLPGLPDSNGKLVFFSQKWSYDCCDNLKSYTDLNGETTGYEVNARGQVTRVSYPDGTEETKEYSLSGLVIRRVSRLGLVELFEYDAFKRPIQRILEDAAGAVLGEETKSYDAFGEVGSVDPAGTCTIHRFDEAGRLSMQVVQGTIGDRRVTRYRYDALGLLKLTLAEADHHQVIESKRSYDNVGRVIFESKGNGEGALCYRYDINGNLLETAVERGENEWEFTSTMYDSHGRPVVMTNGAGETSRYLYEEVINEQGQRVEKKTAFDPMGNQSIEWLDAHRRVVKREFRDAFGQLLQSTQFEYDAKGNSLREVHAVIDTASGRELRSWTLEWKRGLGGRVDAIIEESDKQTEHIYNGKGQLQEVRKPNGVSLYYTYDAFGNVEELTSSDKTVHHTYRYDLAGNIVATELGERQIGLDGLVHAEEFGNGLTIRSEYDFIGRRTVLHPHLNDPIEYTYDLHGLKAIRDADDEEPWCYRVVERDKQGRAMKVQQVGNAGVIASKFDGAGRLLSQISPQLRESLSYDETGRLLLLEDQAQGDVAYEYDALGQVQTESGCFHDTYQHDSLHNRLARNQCDSEVSPRNLPKKSPRCEFDYDENGNMVRCHSDQGAWQFTYDALDRLIEVRRDGELVSLYRYDGFHRRITKELPSGERIDYLYDGDREIGAFADGRALEFRILANQGGPERGATVAIEIGESLYAPLHNYRGDITGLVDADTGEVISRRAYSAFGEVKKSGDVHSSWGFQSKRSDPETGFIYFGRRYYDPEMGRWISPDPTGFEDGPNLYAFVKNNPVTQYDAFGLATEGGPSLWSRIKSGFKSTFRPGSRSRGHWKTSDKNRLTASSSFAADRPFNFHLGEEELNTNVHLGAAHGINTTVEGAFNFANLVKDAYGGANVRCTADPTNGSFIKDLPKAIPALFGFGHEGVVQMAERLTGSVRQMTDPKGVHIEHTFSGGCTSLQLAAALMAKEDRQRIIAHCFAPPLPLKKDLFGGVYNYANATDPITSVGRVERYFNPKDYNFEVIGGGKSVKDMSQHCFKGSPYHRKLLQVAEHNMSKYGRVK